jgi:hypothetical protein
VRIRSLFAGVIVGIGIQVAGAAAPPDLLPAVGIIDFFGLRSVREQEIRQHLPFKEGDRLAREQLVRDGTRIAREIGVAEVTIAYVCCTPDQKVIAYVGVAEKPARERPSAEFTGNARLPEEMIQAEEELGRQLLEAISAQATEDRSQGHALSSYPPMRAVQEKFLAFARSHGALLAEVLATSADSRHRGVAAMILGYAPDKRAAAAALGRGALDPADGVRNNATRALGVIAEYAVSHPDLGIHIDPQPFVEMLNSMVWTDRNKGVMVLTQLTATREAGLMTLLRVNAREALIDMCRWKDPGHSFQPCQLLRRVEGLPESLAPGAREEVLQKVGADGAAPPRPEPRNR